MKIEYLTMPLEDMCKSIGFMPGKACYDCPFIDKELNFCIWYHRHVDNPECAEFCKVERVTIEICKD